MCDSSTSVQGSCTRLLSLLLQVKARLQTIDEPVTVLFARVQAGQLAEVDISTLSSSGKSDCCAYDHKCSLMLDTQAPTAPHMQQLLASMSDASSAINSAEREQAACTVPDQIHQLFEWIGGTSCGLKGMQHPQIQL